MANTALSAWETAANKMTKIMVFIFWQSQFIRDKKTTWLSLWLADGGKVQ